MTSKLRVLLIEDYEDDALLLVEALRGAGYTVETRRIQEAGELQHALDEDAWDLILSDYRLPRFTGLDALHLVRARDPDVPFIIVSGTIGEEDAVEAMRAGAHDYLMKDRLARLAPAVERELREAELRRTQRRAEEAVRRQAQQQTAIARLGQHALAEHDLTALLQTAVQIVADTLGLQYVMVIEVLPDTRRLDVRALLGWPASMRDHTYDFHPSLTAYAFAAGGPLVVPDLAATFPHPPHPVLAEYHITSAATVLIHGSQHPFGALTVDSVERREFQDDEVTFLQSIANVLAAAIERTAMEDQLSHQALHDALTDLPNRVLLLDRLQQAIMASQRGGKSTALLLLDLDHFKEINDTFGHRYGDLVLQNVAARLRRVVRRSDTVARLGGDEFAVLLPAANRAGAARAARKILTHINHPYEVEGHQLAISASIGLALSPAHGEDAMTLLRRADVAMYVAKRTDIGFITYTPDHDQYSPDRLALIAELRTAIEGGQLVLHYQPLVNVQTGCHEHVEALVRWQHPEHGLLAPGRFIELAEHSGLIKPLTLWALDASLAQCRAWQGAGTDMSVAVNLSARNLHDPDLLASITRLLRHHELPADVLQVEITESAVMIEPERARDTLTRLHDLGVRIAMDDFGTGYSSLAYLQRLPLDTVKVDRSFVMDMDSNPENAHIVRSIVALAHNLNLEVTAEGVETGQTLEMLRAMGCDMIQGYVLARPMPAPDVTAWLARPLPSVAS